MSAITVTLTNTCPGGGHFTFTAAGDLVGTVRLDINDIQAALTQDDARSFARVVAWLAKNGRTLAAAKTLLQAGVTITI